MIDTAMSRRPGDRSIHLDDPDEVRFWCSELGLTAPELRYIVDAAGPLVDDVKAGLAELATRSLQPG